MVTDLTGQTGMAIVRAIVDGERDPVRLAGLRDRRCKKSSREFAEHLRGNWRTSLFNLKSALKLYDMTQREIAAYIRNPSAATGGAPRPTRAHPLRSRKRRFAAAAGTSCANLTRIAASAPKLL